MPDNPDNTLQLSCLSSKNNRWPESKDKPAVNNFQEKVTFLDPDFTVIWSNISQHTAFGRYNLNQLNRKCFEIYHGYSEPCQACPVTEVLKTGQAYSSVQYDSDGSLLQTSGIPVKSEDGSLVGVLYRSIDITEFKRAEEALKKKEALLRGVIDNSNYHIYVKDLEGRFIIVSKSLSELLEQQGYNNVLGTDSYQYFDKQSAEQHRANDHKVLVTRKMLQTNETINTRAGLRTFHTTKFPLINEKSECYAICGISIDITDQIEIENELLKSRTLLDKTQRMSRVGGWEYDLRRDQLTWTAETYRIHDFNPADVPTNARKLTNLSLSCFRPEDRPQLLEAFNKCVDKGSPYDLEFQFTSAKGRNMWVRITAEADFSDGQVTKVFGNIMDITERREAEEALKHLSFHDQLTGLYNRRYLEEEMTRLDTARQLPLVVIVADLNGLKLANDVFGHTTGDELIKAAAAILKKSCRVEDIVARWGGDEFAILLPQTSREAAERVYERIINGCNSTCVADIPLSMAVGLAIKTVPDQKTEDLIAEAEHNMYKHKLEQNHSGVNIVVKALLKNLARRSTETASHIKGIQHIAGKIAKQLELSEAELDRLKLLAVLHDIGKIQVAGETLTKKDALTDKEWETIKKHPEIGYRIAMAIKDFAQVADEILAHHEHWDGSGYPHGLEGKDIPFLARIIALADAYEVMSSGRPYKPAMDRSEIIAELNRCSGTQFNAELVEILMEVFKEEDL